MTFTSIDYDKFRQLRVTHVATRFEELISDEANDTLTPEQIFITAVDDALEQRRIHKVDKLIRAECSPHAPQERLVLITSSLTVAGSIPVERHPPDLFGLILVVSAIGFASLGAYSLVLLRSCNVKARRLAAAGESDARDCSRDW